MKTTKSAMKKVVINSSYGGFGVSNEGLLWLINEHSDLVEKTPWSKYSSTPWGEWDGDYDRHDHPFRDGFTTNNLIEGVLVKDEIVYSLKESFPENKSEDWDSSRDKDRVTLRQHPDLIRLVEAIREKKVAKYRFSKLKIVKIPTDVEFTIEEYDGLEHIAEAHRTWY